MNRSESKYFNTALKMDNAFLELLSKKDFAYITVKEICQKAGVNRSTFYLHYETLEDLLGETAQHIINRFVEYMPYETAEFIEKLSTCSLDKLYLITDEYLTPYLNYIKDNRRIFKTTVEHASALKMNDAYRDLNYHILTPILNRFNVPPREQEYVMRFHISGIMAIIQLWLEQDCREPVEFISSVIQKYISRHKEGL